MSIALFVAFLASIAVPECSQEAKTPNDPATVVQENINAMNSEDLDKAMATIDEQSASCDQTKNVAKELFDLYDLKYELDSLKVISQTDDDARVECIQITRKVKCQGFRDNRIVFIRSLKKSEGNWKIYSSKVMKLDDMN